MKKAYAVFMLAFATLLLIFKWRQFSYLLRSLKGLGVISFLLIILMCIFVGMNIYSRFYAEEGDRRAHVMNAVSYIGMAVIMGLMAFAGITLENTEIGQQIMKGGIFAFFIGLMIFIIHFIAMKIKEVTR